MKEASRRERGWEWEWERGWRRRAAWSGGGTGREGESGVKEASRKERGWECELLCFYVVALEYFYVFIFVCKCWFFT